MQLSRADKIKLLELVQEKNRRISVNPLKYAKRHDKQEEFYKAQQVIRALFWGNRCFVKGTLVTMGDGSKLPIESITKGMSVVSYNGIKPENKQVLQPHCFSASHNPKPMIKLIINGKQITSTYDHEYYINKKWVPVYQFVWGEMEASQRSELKLLCKQYGESINDFALWWEQNSSDEARKRQIWVLQNCNGGQDNQGSQGSSKDLDTKHTKQTSSKSQRQQFLKQQDREFRMGNKQGKHNAFTNERSADPSKRRDVLEKQTNRESGYRDIEISKEEQNDEEINNGKRIIKNISNKTRLNKRYFKRQELEVSKIEILQSKERYDLTVEDNHNYVVEDILVHNCGKTEIGAQEVARYLLGEHEHKNIKNPVEIWSICPSFDSQKETTQPKLLRYLPEGSIASMTWIRKGILSELVLKNGSKVTFKSYEQGRAKFQGAGKRLIWFDEEPPHDIWEECFVRQEAGQRLDIVLTMTAIKGMTWVYDDIYLNTDTNLIYVSEAGWDDNPWLTEEQKDIMSRGLTPDSLKVRREGKFVRRVGLVCNWWDRSKHLKEYTNTPIDWTFYEVLDGGYSDPAAWLLLGVDNDDTVHVIDGFRTPLLTTEEIKTKRDTKIGGLHIRAGWGDTDNPRLIKELSALGMYLQPIQKIPGETKSWDETLANKLAEYGMIQKGTGEPRLYISTSLQTMNQRTGNNHNWMMQEIENLLWQERVADGIIETKPAWDDHRKFGHHFDGIRALSYFLVSYKKPNKSLETIVQVEPNLDPYSQVSSGYERL